MSKAPLRLDAEEMRRLGYQVIDHIVDHLEHINEEKVTNLISPSDAADLFKEPIPSDPSDISSTINKIVTDGFSNIMHTDHPRFFSFIPSPSNYISVLADTLAAGFNAFAGHWFSGGTSARIEMTAIDWLCDLMDMKEKSGGIFTSGGSMANLMAISTAREIKLGGSNDRARIYYSNQTHSSLAKGLKVLGLQPEQMVQLPINDAMQIDIAALRSAIFRDKAAGLLPFCIVGNAGTTNAGVVDDLNALADIARDEDCWFHVDGAYGAAAYITDTGKAALSGIHRVDSMTLDPHKWWFQPYEIGCLLVRDHNHLRQTYNVTAEYLIDTKQQSGSEVNFYDYGIQLSRSFRALKFYLSMKAFGLDAFRKAVDHGIQMAQYVEGQLGKDGRWQVVTHAQLGVINFRYYRSGLDLDQLDILNGKIMTQMNDDGYASVITTVIHGKKVLRMVPIHPEVTTADIDETLHRLVTFGDKVYASI